MKKFLSALVAACIVMVAPSAADEAKPNVLQVADYLDYEWVRNPQISPDGKQVIYTRQRVDKMKDKIAPTLWIINTDGTNNRQLMDGAGALWSPDGSRIAFVKPDADGRPQIYTRSMDASGLVTQVTSFEYAPSAMEWAPDGRSIAFVARVAQKSDWKITLPGRPEGAKWTEDPVIVEDLHYRQDRVGYTNTGYDHLFVVSAEGGTPKQLTSGNWNVGMRRIGAIAFPARLSWSPDSRRIAFDGAGKPIESPYWFESHIHVVDVATGEKTTLTTGRGTYGEPAWSPDGKTIAFTGYDTHERLYHVDNLYVIDAAGGTPNQLLTDLPDGPGNLHWAANSKTIYFAMDKEGDRNLHRVDLRGNMAEVTTGDHTVAFASLSNTGVAATVVSSPSVPDAVAIVSNLDRKPTLRTITDVNADLLDGKTLGKVEEVWYEATAETGETARVQGWIVYPPDYDASKTYPLLLSIHGGPNAMYDTSFDFSYQEFAASGYVVLYTNPRGSTGYGEDFANAIDGRYPGPVDYADLMAGVDLLIERKIADPERLFVTGCSGGGVLTTWIIGQTDRFKAAAALCPVVNWIGMSGTTDVAAWLYTFFEEPFWVDPKPWLDHSTIMHVGKVKTPTLLMTGVEDLRTPLGEAEEYFAALKYRGVPTKLVPMVGEYHGTSSIPSNYLRTSLMLRKWFEEFDPGKKAEVEAAVTAILDDAKAAKAEVAAAE